MAETTRREQNKGNVFSCLGQRRSPYGIIPSHSLPLENNNTQHPPARTHPTTATQPTRRKALKPSSSLFTLRLLPRLRSHAHLHVQDLKFWFVFACTCVTVYLFLSARLQSFWQMRRFRGRKTWFRGGKMRRLSGKPRGRRGGPGLLTNRAKSSPLWWRRITKHTTSPTLTFAASGFVSLRSLFDQ